MSPVTDAFTRALAEHVPGIVGAIATALLAVIAAAVPFVVGWLRSHTTQSAVRQAMDAHGDSAIADDAAKAELRRMPAVLRPRNVDKAVKHAVERERLASVPPRGPLSSSPPPTEFNMTAVIEPTAEQGRRIAEALDDEESRPTIPDAEEP